MFRLAVCVNRHGITAFRITAAGQESSVFSPFINHGLAALVTGIFAFCGLLIHVRTGLFERNLKRIIKLIKNLDPVSVGFFDLIQKFFHMAGELYIHDFREMLNKLFCHYYAQIGRIKSIFFFLDIIAFLYGSDDVGVSTRSTDALSFERSD